MEVLCIVFFMVGPTGIFMQQHHYQAVPHGPSNAEKMEEEEPTSEVLHTGQLTVETRRRKTSPMATGFLETDGGTFGSHHPGDKDFKHGNPHSLTSLTLDCKDPLLTGTWQSDVLGTHPNSFFFILLTECAVPMKTKGTPSRSSLHTTEVPADTSLTLLWGATGEQEWTPALTTGWRCDLLMALHHFTFLLDFDVSNRRRLEVINYPGMPTTNYRLFS